AKSGRKRACFLPASISDATTHARCEAAQGRQGDFSTHLHAREKPYKKDCSFVVPIPKPTPPPPRCDTSAAGVALPKLGGVARPRSPPAQRSSRRRSDQRCAAIWSAVIRWA